MDINELYRWRFCLFVNDKLHNRFDSLDFIYSNNLDELKNSYPDYFNEYKLDGLLSPECYAGDKELSLISHNYNVNYKDIPVYYAVLERNSETEYQDNKIIVDRGIAYKSRHYAAGMQRSLYNNFRTYWRCISDDKDVKPYQCCLIHKSIYQKYVLVEQNQHIKYMIMIIMYTIVQNLNQIEIMVNFLKIELW